MSFDISTDPVMQCLVVLTKLNNKPASAEALAHGLPFDPTVEKQRLFSLDKSKSNVSRAAAKAGFQSRLQQRTLSEIPSVVLPVILMLKDDKACVLTQISHSQGLAEIIVPEVDEIPQEIDMERLEEAYLGYFFLLKRTYEGASGGDDEFGKPSDGHWFFGTMMRFKGIYARVLLGTLLVNLFVVAGPLFTMNVYDRIIPHNATETLWVLASGICLVYLFDLVMKCIRTSFLETAAKKSDIILSSILFEQAMNLKLKERPRSVGSFANNIKDFESIRSFFTSSAVTAFIEVPFAVLFMIVIYSIHPVMARVPLTVMGVIFLTSLCMKAPIYRIVESTHEAAARKNGILVEALANLETIKAFNAGSSMQWAWEESTGDIATKSLRSRVMSNALSIFSAFLTQFSSVAIIVVGVYLIKAGELSMGGLIAINMLSSRTIAPMSQVVSLLAGFEQMRAGLKSLDELMNKEVERPVNKQFIRRQDFRGEIEFKEVSFAYPGEQINALTDVSFRIKAGEKVGIIGQVGSGKSTISKILLGFYEQDKGSIFIDGLDIRQIDPVDLRHHFSYVPQDVILFSGTVRDNLTLKLPHADDRAIIRAAEIAGVNVFTDRHPLGMDLQVGERGANLSGGQRQSVALGRCFIDETPLVLLDEPTNAMDYNTELQVITNLKQVTQGKTTVIITHKPTILEVVDRIIVMNNGCVAMDGPKAEVLAKLGGAR